MSILGGMLSPDSGTVALENISLYDLSIDERAKLRRERIGFVFQTFNLLSYLSALDNVRVPLFLAGCGEGAKATSLLESRRLGRRLDHRPGEPSTRQQQRVALARTLANDPAAAKRARRQLRLNDGVILGCENALKIVA